MPAANDLPPAAAGDDRDALAAEVERLRSELASCRQLLGQVMAAGDRDRREIAQQLHDQSLQSLLSAHQELLEAAPGRAQVTRAHEVVAGAIDRLREAVVALHPVTLERRGLAQAVSAVARESERQGGFESELDIDEDAAGEHAALILACARELLTNAARHSGAGRVWVTVRGDGADVVLEVADDGSGIDPDRPEEAVSEGHIGLASVVQRLGSEGGRLELTERPGGGTRAIARLPAARDSV
ncbi:MAG TPA: ATP-binding protein [Solirubrobacterales bacterium]|nr:ATP-binding protein [Solirubrobacterales bacterium]